MQIRLIIEGIFILLRSKIKPSGDSGHENIMVKNWVIKQQGDESVLLHLQEVLGVDRPIANLLKQRGIETFEQAKYFFRPELSQLHDPFLMKDMDRAIERIEHAISSGEKIMVYGDYDVDGTTAVALVYSYLKQFSHDILYYIPDRYDEGYGISIKGIDFASANSVRLVIALDCGIKAVEKIVYANAKLPFRLLLLCSMPNVRTANILLRNSQDAE